MLKLMNLRKRTQESEPVEKYSSDLKDIIICFHGYLSVITEKPFLHQKFLIFDNT